MLERLFTSKSRVKVLELLLLNPTVEFYLMEILRQTRVSAPYVQRELASLVEFGKAVKT